MWGGGLYLNNQPLLEGPPLFREPGYIEVRALLTPHPGVAGQVTHFKQACVPSFYRDQFDVEDYYY